MNTATTHPEHTDNQRRAGDNRGARCRRLGIFVTHPIQYFAPLWRKLAQAPGLDLVVHFFSDHSVRGGVDPGFGIEVKWDVPLLTGYEHRFVTKTADLSRPHEVSLPSARQALRDGAFDAILVHGYTHRFERQVVRAAWQAGLQTLLRGELTDVPPDGGRSRLRAFIRDAYLWWFYRHIDAFCYIGEEARLHLTRRGIPEQRMFFSPYSVDTDLFETQRRSLDRATARHKLGIGEGQIAILFSGKLIPRKDPLLVLEAIQRLGNPANLWLIVVGDGELRRQVEERGRNLLGSRFVAPGFVNQNQLGAYFVAADVLVLPSLYETWGLVVNEAMQFGLPVIVSAKVGCQANLVVPGETGFTFPVGGAQALAEHFRSLLAAPQSIERMGKAARERIAGYNIDASARGILDALAGTHLDTRKHHVGQGPSA